MTNESRKTPNYLFGLFFSLALIAGVLMGIRFLLKPAPEAEPVTTGEAITARKTSITINGQTIGVELADTQEKIIQGLSGREGLAEGTGMLFVFEQPGRWGFWMKDMKFNLDFVFLNDRQVVDLAENVPAPQGNELPATINATADFDKVLEIPAGTIQKLQIKLQDRVGQSF